MIITLLAGDVLVLELERNGLSEEQAYKVTSGKVVVDAKSNINKDGAILSPVIMDEAYAAHDNGKLVYEKTEAFTGLWRDNS